MGNNRILLPAADPRIIVPAEGYFWKPMEDRSGNWRSEKFGQTVHTVIAEPRPDGLFNPKGDFLRFDDGPTERPYAYAQSSAFLVPYRLDGNVVIFSGLMQERFILIPGTNEWAGPQFTWPGGYALIGEEPDQVAQRQALEEAGIKIHKMERVGAGSPNRMFIPNCGITYIARYEYTNERPQPILGFEKIIGTTEIRTNEFPSNCLDMLTWASFMMACLYLKVNLADLTIPV